MKSRGHFYFRYLVFLMVCIAACDGKKNSDAPELTAAEAARAAGLEYLDQGDFSKAEKEFSRLIEIAPNEVIGYTNLGIVYMRQGKLMEAEEQFNKALEIDPENVVVRLNLYELYQQTDDADKSLDQLNKILEYDPDNLFALYKMSERSQSDQQASMTSLDQYLTRIIETAPKNIVPRIYLLEYLLENNHRDQAVQQFEEIQSAFERLPEESQVLFDQAYQHLLSAQTEQAYQTLVMFHNQLKLSNWYQADLRALRGSEYSQIGIPVISFSRKMMGFGSDDVNQVYKSIRFNGVAENAGLVPENVPTSEDSFVVLEDLDNDGDQDLLYGLTGPTTGKALYLYRNELGRFEETVEDNGIADHGNVQFATFGDYDNDGFLDLLLITDGSVKLYHNVDELQYEDVTSNSGLQTIEQVICALWFDADHDGDLDLFLGTSSSDRLFQNNGSGSFSDISGQAGIESNSPTSDAVIGDFDDDGDLDFFVTSEGGNKLYSNTRMGTFEDITASSGISGDVSSSAVSTADYNNDGYQDLFVSDDSGKYSLYVNQGKAIFKEDVAIRESRVADSLKLKNHAFFDYDNDGFLDLILVGEPQDGGIRGMKLLHNNQQFSFEDASWSLPENIATVRSMSIGDYNEDGDLDVFVSYNSGNIGLLRNDGGNMNYQLKVQLIGLREGSGKNNFFGIGSKVEIRTGPGYQMRTVSSSSEYFGLGAFERADILRIRWTNGVPQNIFAPHSDLDFIEQQRLKGSCPFLYTWNGSQFIFVKDMMWRSALGMPLGIMTSDDARAYAFADASREYLKIPGEMLESTGNNYQLKITGELWETIYLDELVLYAVDHPAGIDFLLDEKFVPPPFPDLNFYPISQKHVPVSVTEGNDDLLDKVRDKDNDYISNFKRSKFQGITEMHDLIIDLGAGVSTDNLHLFLNGWIFPSDASINVAVGQSPEINVVPPYLQVLDKRGEWVTAIENLGFPLGKNKTMVSDLSKVFRTKDRKIRIRTSMQIYWDHIYYGYVNKPFEGTVTPMQLDQADLHFRGFSTEFRKGGPNGPHWFDYNQVTTEPKWLDLEGKYTRYGDVAPLLKRSDNQYIIYNAGDEVSISYSKDGLPELPDGWTRDFVIYSVGWVKDGDLNTAYGQTVDPLPFHGMPSYPYPENYRYPFTENEVYLKEYNTRSVTPDAYRDHIKDLNPKL